MPENGCGIWNERAMPLWQRRSGGRLVTSSPANITRPLSGLSVPVARPNRLVLPAPLGPIMPSASPSLSKRSILSATTTAPKRFEIFSRPRIGGITKSAAWLQLSSDRNVRRGLVLGDDKIELAVLALPLSGNKWRLGDILHRGAGPLNRPYDRLIVCSDDRFEYRFRIIHVFRALEDVDRHLEQSVLESDGLCPRPV